MPINLRKLYVHGYQSFVWNRAATERIQRHGLKPVIGDLVIARDDSAPPTEAAGDDRIQHVETVTAENMHLYGIEDIVLPLPGHRIQYPSNDIGDVITQLMGQDELDPLKMERKVE